eukprot:scaffold6.g2757.t1
MAPAPAAALLLRSHLKFSNLARITLPVAQAADEGGADEGEEQSRVPPPLPPALARAEAAVRAVAALSTLAMPLVVWRLDSTTVQVVCARTAVSAVFKQLLSRQQALGVVVGGPKAHVDLSPMPRSDLATALTQAVQPSLRARGWWQLAEGRLLSTDLLAAADGALHTAQSICLEVGAADPQGQSLTLLLKPETVRFLHVAARQGRPDTGALCAELAGSLCAVLPAEQVGVIDSVVPADAAVVERLRAAWLDHGLVLPQEVPYLIHVRFDEDEDADAFPIPPCCLLSRGGLATEQAKLGSADVRAILARVKADLEDSASPLWGGKSLACLEARVWYPDGPPPAPGGRRQHHQQQQEGEDGGGAGMSAFQSALLLARAPAAAAAADGPALGGAIDLAAAAAPEAGDGGLRPKRRQTMPDAALRAFMDKAKAQREAEEENHRKPAGPTPAPTAPKPVPARTVPAPLRPGNGGGPPAVPQFGKKAGPAPAAAKGAAGGASQKRAAAAKAPKAAAPKKAKAAAAGAAGGLPPGADGSAATASQPPAAAAAAAAATGDGGAGAAVAAGAAPKPAAKARPKAADMDIAAVAAKVRAAAAAGTLGKLTLPELKCFLKSERKAVGGKKADLEARVLEHLGLGAPGRAA